MPRESPKLTINTSFLKFFMLGNKGGSRFFVRGVPSPNDKKSDLNLFTEEGQDAGF